MPSSPGMRRSTISTSGDSASTAATAASPLSTAAIRCSAGRARDGAREAVTVERAVVGDDHRQRAPPP